MTKVDTAKRGMFLDKQTYIHNLDIFQARRMVDRAILIKKW